MTADAMLDAALSYAAKGWAVFPLIPNGKTPLGKLAPHGVKDASTDENVILDWWLTAPTANIGIACGKASGGLYVVDVDAPNGGHKHDGFKSLLDAGIDLQSIETQTVETPSGGAHFYFQLQTPPNPEKLHNVANANGWQGVDYRADAGYVVGVPSVIDGKAYRVRNHAATLAPFPDALYLRPKAPPTPKAAPPVIAPETITAPIIERARLYLTRCDAAISGQGGHTATLHAAHALVVGFGLTDADALSLLVNEYNPRCVPPWTEKELCHKVESARQKPQKPVGYLLADDAPKVTVDESDARLGAQVAANLIAQSGLSNRETAQDAFAERYARRMRLDAFPDPMPEEDDPDVLFAGGWLKRGGGAFFISVSGAGKSVAATQACACWGVGRDFFGIKPTRPLRISVFQAEDDAREVADFRNNIRRGLIAAGWTAEEVDASERANVYHDTTGLTGRTFLQYLRRAQQLDKADLLIINPFQSYAGCDISKNADLSDFLRVQLEPILKSKDAPCAALIIHHTNKAPSNANDRKAWLDTNSAAYGGAGGAEIVNWARAILTLRPHEKAGFYDLIAAKRGKRLGWRDASGAPTQVKTLAHSDGLMFWREADAQELAEVEVGQAFADNSLRRKIVELVEKQGPFASRDKLIDAISSAGICQRTKACALICQSVDNGELIKKRYGNTRADSYLTKRQANEHIKPRNEDDDIPF